MANGHHFEKLKIGHRTISINAKACSCQKCHTPSRPELYATLTTLPISPNKTAKIIKTKLTSVSLHCKSRRYKTANIKILSANSKHRR